MVIFDYPEMGKLGIRICICNLNFFSWIPDDDVDGENMSFDHCIPCFDGLIPDYVILCRRLNSVGDV